MASLWAEVSVVGELSRAEKTRVERLERKTATEIEKRQQLLAERQERIKATPGQLPKGEIFCRDSDLTSSL